MGAEAIAGDRAVNPAPSLILKLVIERLYLFICGDFAGVNGLGFVGSSQLSGFPVEASGLGQFLGCGAGSHSGAGPAGPLLNKLGEHELAQFAVLGQLF